MTIRNLLWSALAALCLALPVDAAAEPLRCEAMSVPVNVPGAPGASIYGELCLPSGPTPATVQLLVHSTWYNLRYWDPPQIEYSYVRAAVAAGYATFNVDRLGTGRSTKPANQLVTIDSVEDTLHQVIVGLRAGTVGGHAFAKVVWVGSSFGSGYGWVNGARHPGDADAYVITGLLHQTKKSFVELLPDRTIAACADPAFAHLGLDCGYITNRRGAKGDIYYYLPGAAPGMVDDGVDDAILRDVVSATLLLQSADQLGGVTHFTNPTIVSTMPPGPDPLNYSYGIHVPTLIVVGDKDNIFCGPPDGLDCSAAGVAGFEAAYYSVVPDVYIAPDAGHATNLHRSGPATAAAMNAWIDAKVGAH